MPPWGRPSDWGRWWEEFFPEASPGLEHRDAHVVEEIFSDDEEPDSDSDDPGIVMRRSRAPQSHLESAALKIRRAKRQGDSNVILTHREIDALVRTSSMRDPRRSSATEIRRVSMPTYNQRGRGPERERGFEPEVDSYEREPDVERYREPDVERYREPDDDRSELEPERERYARDGERQRGYERDRDRDRDRDYDRDRERSRRDRRDRRDRRSLEPSSQSTSPQRSREARAAWSRRRRPTVDRGLSSSLLASQRPVRTGYAEAPTSTPASSRRQSRRSTRVDERDRLTPPTPEEERGLDRRVSWGR
jgi:hypothetical protein